MSKLCAAGHQPQAAWTFQRWERDVLWLGFVCQRCPRVLWREATAAEVQTCQAR